MNILDIVLLVLQLTLFVGGRICDDLSWYLGGNLLLQGLSFSGLALAIIIKVFRSRVYNKPFLVLAQAQFAMIIPWAVTVVVAYFYYQTFGGAYDTKTNVISILVIVFTTMCYGTLCSVHLLSTVQVLIYGFVLLGQMVFYATLLIEKIEDYQGVQKDCFILYQSSFIAMQILITDILQRVNHKKKELFENKSNKVQEYKFIKINYHQIYQKKEMYRLNEMGSHVMMLIIVNEKDLFFCYYKFKVQRMMLIIKQNKYLQSLYNLVIFFYKLKSIYKYYFDLIYVKILCYMLYNI